MDETDLDQVLHRLVVATGRGDVAAGLLPQLARVGRRSWRAALLDEADTVPAVTATRGR